MKTTKKTVMKKPTVKKMSTGGTTKKMSYGGVKPKALKKASEGMISTDSECSGWPPGKKCHGFNRKAVPGSVRRAQKRPRRF